MCQPQTEVKVRSLQSPKETQGSLEPLTPGAESEKFQGDREASSQGDGQREVRTEEEDGRMEKPVGDCAQHSLSRYRLDPQCNGRRCRAILRGAALSDLL